MQKAILKTQDLAIGYKHGRGSDTRLHENIGLGLNSGEICCLLGPNGSGKSTLIRTLVGFQQSLGGEVSISGKNINHFSAGELAKKISVVLTEQMEPGIMTVFDMVAFGRSPYTGFLGKLNYKDRNAIVEALEKTGIAALHTRLFAELSDGEKQKVMIAKSLAQQTPLIILDEPAAFLDFPSKIEIMHLLRKTAWDDNKAVLLSTHDLNLALQFADKLWLMGKGVPMRSGLPEDLILAGHLAELFDRDKTRFDLNTGNFEYKTTHIGNVNARGDEIEMVWLRRALARKGYSLNNSNESLACIDFNKDMYQLKQSLNSLYFSTIAEVLNHLKSKNSS